MTGINLDKAMREARRLGARIVHVHATGEIRFEHDEIAATVRVNSRRKSAPRTLTTWLKHLIRRST